MPDCLAQTFQRISHLGRDRLQLPAGLGQFQCCLAAIKGRRAQPRFQSLNTAAQSRDGDMATLRRPAETLGLAKHEKIFQRGKIDHDVLRNWQRWVGLMQTSSLQQPYYAAFNARLCAIRKAFGKTRNHVRAAPAYDACTSTSVDAPCRLPKQTTYLQPQCLAYSRRC